MGSTPILSLTQFSPLGRMSIPVADPDAAVGLKNGRVTIADLLGSPSAGSDSYAAVRIEVPAYANVQAALTASLEVPNPAYVYAPSGSYAETGPVSLALGGYSLTVDGDADAVFNFPAGNGFTFTNAVSDLTAVTFKNAKLVTAATAPAGTALAINNPLFVSGQYSDQTQISNLYIAGDWATGLAIAGAPQGVIDNVRVAFPYGNTTSGAMTLVGNGASGISTNYMFRNCGGVDAGGTWLNIGADVQGVILDACYCFEYQAGVVWNNPSVAGDFFQMIGGNYACAQPLNLSGTSASILYNVQVDGAYLYGPPAPVVGGVQAPFVNLNYCWFVYLNGMVVGPDTAAPYNITNSKFIEVVGGRIFASTIILAGSSEIGFSGVQIQAAAFAGGAGPALISGCKFIAATVFSGAQQDMISGCHFDVLPDFTAAGYNPILVNNWFAGVFYREGAPPACLGAGYLNAGQALATSNAAYYAQQIGGAGGTEQITANFGNVVIETPNAVNIVMPAAPALPVAYVQDLAVTFAVANAAVSWALGTGTQVFMGPAPPASVAAGQEVRFRWVQFLGAWLNVSTAAGVTDVTHAQVTPAGGTVARPLNTILGLIHNVKDFGAVGNGSTDDTAAIQATLTEAALIGGSVYVPDGLYLISGTLASSYSGLLIQGQSWNATLQRQVGFAGTVLQCTGANAQVRNLTIDGNGVNQTSSNELTNNGSGAITDSVQILNSYRIGINSDGNYTKVNNCLIVGCGPTYPTVQTGQGVWAATPTYVGKQVTNCTILNTGIEGIAMGGTGYLVSGNTLSGCHQYTLGGGGQICCYPQSFGTTSAHGIVSNNRILGGGSSKCDGIELVGQGILCSNNFLININSAGIACDYGSNHSIIGNVMINMGLSYPGATNLGLACGIILFNNSGADTSILIESNQISDNQATPTTACGVFVSSGSGGAGGISGNLFQNLINNPTAVSIGVYAQGTWPVGLVVSNNKGIDDVVPSLSSGATITLPANPIIHLTNNTPVTAITGAAWPGRQVTFIPDSAVTFTAGASIANSSVATPNAPLTAVCDASGVWHITGPSGSSSVSIDNATILKNTAGQLYAPNALKVPVSRSLQMYCAGADKGIASGTLGFLNVTAGNTVGCIIQIPPKVAWVRFRFSNNNSSGNMVITNAAYAPTSQIGGGIAPYDDTGTGQPTFFNPITFNNGGVDISLAQQILNVNPGGSNTYTLTVPPNQAIGGSNLNNYFFGNIAYSDWMPFAQGVVRIDGGAGQLINVRASFSDGNQYVDYAGPPNPSCNYTVSGYYAGGNIAVSPYAASTGTAGVNCNPVHGIDCIGSGKTFSILSVGDSIAAGSTSTSDISAYPLWAAGILNSTVGLDKYVVLANQGFGGQTSTYFMANAYNLVQHSAFDLAIIQCWSLNDQDTTKGAGVQGLQTALALADECTRLGIQVILCTGAPVFNGVNTSGNLTQETVRQFVNLLVRQSGYPVLDLDAILGTGATPINAYAPGYCTTAPHPNDAGHQAVGIALAGLIQPSMGT